MSDSIRLPKDVIKIMANLESNGFEVFAVGGCIRDSLMKNKPADWDLCTSATPNEILRVFDEYVTIPVGVKYGTIMVCLNGKTFEITTYRTESEYIDGRHPEGVNFVRNIEDDLKRRDFTINAVAYNKSRGIIDPCGGIEDLKNKIIRCVGNPHKRFSEDSLRIMRAIRFAAVFNFNIEPYTDKALLESTELLSRVSSERILSELDKIVMSEKPDLYIRKYKNVFEFIIGTSLTENNIKMMRKLPKDASMRYAALFYSVDNKLLNKIMRNLKFSRRRCDEINIYISSQNEKPCLSRTECKKFLSKYGADTAGKCITFLSATDETKSAIWEKIRNIIDDIADKNECYLLSDLDINGNDIKKLGYSGKEIGCILDRLLNEVMEERLINLKEDLVCYIKQNFIL